MNKKAQIDSREVITTILNQKEDFTINDILNDLSKDKNEELDLTKIIKDKLDALCEINLVKDTVLYYYVR
ncbi:MAG: hypothetical protein GX982_02425 [Tissierellia bacterium]|nr:hypothetical protein [Tissierellia bacterium]